MTSCVDNDIDEATEKVFKRRISLRKGFIAIYGGQTDSEYHLRYILRCLGLPISGTKEELITRIQNHGINIGDKIHDPSDLGTAITSRGLDYCPTYLLKAYLKKHELQTTGTKLEIASRVRQHLGSQKQIPLFNFLEDKKLIYEAICAIDRGKEPSEKAICIMEQYGYFYDPSYKTFFNMETHEKILGTKSFFESLWFMTYPSFPKETMEFIPNETNISTQ